MSIHLRLGLPSDLLPSGVPTNILYAVLASPFVLHALPTSSSSTSDIEHSSKMEIGWWGIEYFELCSISLVQEDEVGRACSTNGEARNACGLLVGTPEGKRDCSTGDLVVIVIVASSEKKHFEGGEGGALKIVAKVAYLLTDCALGPGGHF